MKSSPQPPTLILYSELQEAFDHFNHYLFENKLPPCMITLQREARTFGYFSVERFIRQDGTKIDEIALNPEYFAVRTIAETLSTLVHEMVHLQQQHFGAPGRGRYHNHEWANWMEIIGLIPSHTGEEGGRRTGDRVSHYILKKGRFDQACQRLLTQEYQISWMDRFPPPQSLVKFATSRLNLSPQVTGPVQPSATLTATDHIDENKTAYTISALLGAPLLGTAIAVPEISEVERTILPISNRSNRLKYVCAQCGIQVWGKPALNILCGDCQQPLKST